MADGMYDKRGGFVVDFEDKDLVMQWGPETSFGRIGEQSLLSNTCVSPDHLVPTVLDSMNQR